MSHPSPVATAVPAGPPACLDASPPLAGKRRGNPDLGLAPRCGARTRGGCPCRAPAIHGKLRCRMHGGRSTGPRTEQGMARLRTARTIHGGYGAETRARNRHDLTSLRRGEVGNAAVCCVDRLPPEFSARLWEMPSELLPPPWPTGGLTPAEDRAVLRAEAEALAPWRQAIAQAGQAGRVGRGAADGVCPDRATKAHTPEPAADGREVSPIAGRAMAGGPIQQLAEAHAPVCAGCAHEPQCGDGGGDAALATSPAAPVATQARAHAPEPAVDRRDVGSVAVHATAGGPIQHLAGAHASEYAGEAGGAALAASPGAPVATQARAYAPEPGADGSGISPVPVHAMTGGPVQQRSTAHVSEVHAPEARAPERDPAASDAAPPALLNRATRRRWKRLQRQLYRGSGMCPQPMACG
jgi:hypothetical protein